MYLRLNEGEDSHLEIQNSDQAVSPKNRIGLFEFWDNLFVECGRLTYAIDHFHSSATDHDENFFLDLNSVSMYYGSPTLSANRISGIFEPDFDSDVPPLLPSLELFGAPNSVESHPPFYGLVKNAPPTHLHDVQPASPNTAEQVKAVELENPDLETPRIEVVGAVSELCRFHEKVEAILCSQSTKHAEFFRHIGASARLITKDHNWPEALAKFVKSKDRRDTKWLDTKLTSNSKNATLPEWYMPKSFHKLWLKALTFNWYSHLNDRRHPLDIAGELWKMLTHHKPLVKQLVKRTGSKLSWQNPDHHPQLVIEETVYQLVQKVPGHTPNEAWVRHNEQLFQIGIESANELKKLCKASRQRQKS